jgi:solute:Na+ symporter, SSS family
MLLSALDWTIIAAFFVVSLVVGLAVARRAGRSTQEYFLSGRTMPWWLLGVSMVATTFAIDTPNLVTDIVRQNGVSGNWVWWAFLLTGMLTTFVYARLWRRSNVTTDLEFYELRYSGQPASFLRAFRAIYLGVFFNVMIMANVCLAAIKLGGVVLGLSPAETLIIASVVTVIYSSLGGLRGVIITDFLQFGLAMLGSVWATWLIVQRPEIGGLSSLLAHPSVVGRLNFFPDFNNSTLLVGVLIVPLAVQWWSVWYPGAEPGGGGYVAQRMLSARDERHATGATLFFNLAHYALRPWPWILVALASLVMYPTLESIQAAFPHVAPGLVRDDLAYPAMLAFLPAGVLGLVISSLVAAFMSTISTHLNWGASYVVNDVYRRFWRPGASEAEFVLVGRAATVLLMILGAVVALALENALQAFNILLSIGAGTGLIFILRWFWWRISALTEIAGMIFSFLVALFFEFGYRRLGLPPLSGAAQLVLSVGVTTALWLLVTFLTRPTDEATLHSFYRLIRPSGPGWERVRRQLEAAGEQLPAPDPRSSLPRGLLNFFIGTIAVYAALFGLGSLVYGRTAAAAFLLLLAVGGGIFVVRSLRQQTSGTAPV